MRSLHVAAVSIVVALPALLAWAAGCAGDPDPRGGCPPATHREGAVCVPILGVECPMNTRFVDGGGCVWDAPDASSDAALAEGDFIAPWLLGRWATNCKERENAYRVERTGPASVRRVHENGNSYEFDIVIEGDVIEFRGMYEGTKQIIKERIISHTETLYFYHFFNGSEWPANGTYVKCD